ncbi:M14 family zinc carboxypeptidase [Constantimarinum furrinae]|uniref:Zinc carboxypeptidase n=1 Tax=Constantimarinum furrinae TaxID=2562285 RepID=A0A7G8PQQ3_9FLAO|nr:M14 family zinc carboxypeptidase [Constantimarinum furrinae]QNJ96669.1 zinc carboxypeptidase [Constantimarinum furrinae]
MKKLRYLPILLCFFLSTAQTNELDLTYYLPSDVTYNPSIPTPKSVIGHEVGEWHITHDKLAHYMTVLAEVSDRISIENRGTTFEGRPLLLLTITAPANHNNIAQIKKDHLALSDLNSGSLNTANMPAVVYQGFSIHGNEPSGSNAALAVAYYLAAAQGPKIEELLNNTVILFDPSLNPDGLQRFSYWANVHKSININPDPNDREYDEVWPGGRTNHYWFDMNRDWLPVQLPESRARIATFHEWRPNILTDHHEMGTNSSFFFQPGIPSRTHPLTPQKNQDLTAAIGKFHARAFDKLGSFYYSEENFDDFYYGKGSTFPDINGSIGILFEQASSRGHAQESDNGVLTFPFTVRNQFTAALSTLEAAVSMRKELLDYQREFFNNARSEATGKAIVFGDSKDAAKAYHLAEILDRHQIKFHELKADFESNGKTYKKGYSYVVPMNQKNSRLITAMFEKRITFTDSLFYDISAWSFPLAFNLDYNENVAMNNAGELISDLKMKMPAAPVRSNYAYLMEWHEYYSPKALNMILKEGLRAKVGMTPFTLENNKYDYGTILIPVQNQKLQGAALAEFLAKVSSETKVTITGVSTGLAQGNDLGSNMFRAVELPKVAMIVGEGINPSDAGEIWHLFDTRYDMQITKLDTRNFNWRDLSRYTDIILPASWGNALDKDDAEKLKTWVKDGGTLIGYRNAGRWLNSNEFLKMKFKSVKDTATNISFEQRGDYFGAQVIGGAIFEAELDRSHPIAFGYKNSKLPMFRNTTIFVEADDNSYNNPIKYTNNPLMSGYISKPNLKELGGTVPFKTSGMGRGQVIYFTDNTNFRAFWYGTNKLLMNAIFFGDEM